MRRLRYWLIRKLAGRDFAVYDLTLSANWTASPIYTTYGGHMYTLSNGTLRRIYPPSWQNTTS